MSIMKRFIYRGDFFFALLLAFFLCWPSALQMEQYSWLNFARLLMRYVALGVLLEVLFMLIAYLRGKSLFGRAHSVYFSWRRTLPVAIIVSGAYVAFWALSLAAPIPLREIITLGVLFLLGVAFILLYLYSLVR